MLLGEPRFVVVYGGMKALSAFGRLCCSFVRYCLETAVKMRPLKGVLLDWWQHFPRKFLSFEYPLMLRSFRRALLSG